MNKICTECNLEKTEEDFYFANKNKTTRYGRCKKCHNKHRKTWAYAGGASVAEYQRAKYHEYRNQVLKFLGGKCVHCGYDENPLGLDIDHINDDGWVERSGRKGANITMLKKWLERDCAGLQILCGTCHAIKTRSS